jgi:inner membrane organizing system protein 1
MLGCVLFFFFTGSPTTRWASVALGAGVGIGAAYTECSYLFNGAPPKWSPKVWNVPSAYSEVTALSFSVNPG